MTVAGVFVGGASRRMGGEPKGLLHVPGTEETVAGRMVRLARAAGAKVVLVGDASAYGVLGVPAIADDPPGVGPLGGLAALLAHAGDDPALALACDLPFVEGSLLAALAFSPTRAPVLAPRRAQDAPWEPLLARYDSPRVLPVLHRAIADGVRSFQDLFARIEVERFDLGERWKRAIDDWDDPSDIAR